MKPAIILIVLTIVLISWGCGLGTGQPEKYTEKRVVPINGRPVIVPYPFHLKKGMLTWNFKGELSNEVRVGEYYRSVFEIPDSWDSIPTGVTLNGEFASLELGVREFVSRSELTILIFIPKPGAKGEIEIEFNESAVGFLF